MAHHKRRRRRRGGIKGCCYLCSLRTTNGTRNTRRLTMAERRAAQSEQEWKKDSSIPYRTM
jgi:hypothetical protein